MKNFKLFHIPRKSIANIRLSSAYLHKKKIKNSFLGKRNAKVTYFKKQMNKNTRAQTVLFYLIY